jgi:hypothetical protein
MADAAPRLDDMIERLRQARPGDDALGLLSDAVLAAEQLGELADHLIGHFVDQARRAGASWTDIGRSMGVSKQAAQQRFVPRGEVGPSTIREGRFGRFTDRARHVVVVSEHHARTAGNPTVDVPHVMLGLLDEREGLAALALQARGLDLDEVAAAVRTLFGPTVDALPEHIPFSQAAKRTLELTLRKALLLGHNYIGTEHILLAVLADDTPTARLLQRFGVREDEAEAWVASYLTNR